MTKEGINTKIKKWDNKEVTLKDGDKKIKVSFEQQDVNVAKEGDDTTIKGSYQEGDAAAQKDKTIKVKVDKGFFSYKIKVLEVDGKPLKEPISAGVKGFRTQGIIMIVVIIVVVLALLAGLWYWMTRKSPEDEE